MNSQIQRINRNMLTGWTIIAAILLVTYTIEVFKGERSLPYLLVFAPIVVIPLAVTFVFYFKKPTSNSLGYFIVPGYFILYIFVMLTGKSIMVCTYILPMLSLLVLYHHPNLILFTGIGSLIVNGMYIAVNIHRGNITVANSDQSEIQIALMLLCFGGSYAAARLYDGITKENNDYMKMLNTKSDQVRVMSLQTITIIANVLDAKDPYTEGHSQRVAQYSAQLAEALGLNKEELSTLHKIAMMHDIGKIGVPDSVLNKPGRLTDEEFAIMKNHSTIGGDIVKNITTIPGIYEVVRHHHERYDGRGYPDGLKGEEIPYLARIITVADSFDAMTSNRVYRKHLNREIVINELEKCAGTQFDPVIAAKMVELLKDGDLKILSPEMENESVG